VTDTNPTTALVAALRDEAWRGPAQHLRSWHDLDRLHEAAADEIERLRSALGNIARRYAPPADEVTARFAREILGEGWMDA